MRNSLRKLTALALVATLILSACGTGSTPPDDPPPPPAVQQEAPAPTPPATEEPELDEYVAQPPDYWDDFAIWQLFTDLDLDYIWLTNASGTMEPQKLIEGDEFLGLTVQSIRARGIEGVSMITGVYFYGQLVLSGDLTMRTEFSNSFSPHKQYSEVIPDLANVIPQEFAFSLIGDETSLLEMLNLESLDENVVFENVTVRINGIYVGSGEGRSFPSATIIEIIDLGR